MMQGLPAVLAANLARMYAVALPATTTCLLSSASASTTAAANAPSMQTGRRQQPSSSSSSSPPSSPQAQSTTWQAHTNSRFSIRPSYLSPLYGAYRLEQARSERRELVRNLLDAHSYLVEEVDGVDDVQIKRAARRRVQQMQALLEELALLQPSKNVDTCTDPGLMYGYFALLEEAARQRDVASQHFSQVQMGKEAVWSYWIKHFAGKYRSAPSLEPLEAIYAKQQLQDRADEEAQRLASPQQPREVRHGATMDEQGTAKAIGKRKSSVAKVSMTQGQGRVSINGVPYDEYFRDVSMRAHVLKPLFLADGLGKYDVSAAVAGGGFSAQAQAVGCGIARALVLHNPLVNRQLKALSTWDGRVVERKKHGRKKARKGFAWVKR